MQAWSYSALSMYETCPKKFYHLRVAKDFKDVKGEAGEYGDKVHKAIEQFMKGNTNLPIDLAHHKEYLKSLRDLNGEKLVELKLAVNQQLKPTGWFDDDVFCRVIVDYAVIGDEYALLIDWKTGKMKDNMDQLKLMAAVLHVHKPELRAIRAEYY